LHTFENDTGPDGANHAQNGMILWRRAGGARGSGQLEGAKITDVAPTVLEILGLAIPQDMEGKPLVR
jgi:bisphosphoglycerate-independent phosphoglycerate mutase (AlkP superfamily)